MGAKRGLTSTGAQKRAARERQVGLEPEDEAAKWLAEHDPPPAPKQPQSPLKSKAMHQWRRRTEVER
jgi:hypothetical protein